MTDGVAIERPVLWGQVGPAVSYAGSSGRPVPNVRVPSHTEQGQRLGTKMTGLDAAFDEQIDLMQSLGASDPQLVVVLEAVDERIDLAAVAQLVGFEVLTEVETTFDDDPAFPRTRSGNYTVSACLHAVCVSQAAKQALLSQWSQWQRDGRLDYGYSRVRDLFQHLKDVRPWGPQDRVRLADLGATLGGLITPTHEVELELWFRQSDSLRHEAQRVVTELVQASGGVVLSSAVVEAVGYHGLKCTMPVDLLRRVASGDFDAISAVKSSHVMYMRVRAQAHSFSAPVAASPFPAAASPSGDPVLCVLDGFAVANHPRLHDRVVVYDPDDLEAASATDPAARHHGTAISSVAVWGDLSLHEEPAGRPVLVRPILVPGQATQGQDEELPQNALAPDLMRRVFRELFEESSGAAPSVVVVNLSVGDPSSPFDGVLSSWARTLDWLTAAYGVLVVISAGNHGAVSVTAGAHAVKALTGVSRVEAINEAVAQTSPRRSLLAPADSVNALTVGALSADGTGNQPMLGYRFDAADGELIVSPLSALGAGHRRSIKPEVIAPGGRVFFRDPVLPTEEQLHPATQAATGPGIRVAASDGLSEVFTTGTSPAAALVSKAAAGIVDTVTAMAKRPLTRAEQAVAVKAMLSHGLRVPDELLVDGALGHHAHGYGVPIKDLATGCEIHEAAVLFVSDLGAGEERALSFPLPNGLQAVGIKRVTATLAWLTPVNWRHRQYRRAALEFTTPSGSAGMPPLGSSLDVSATDAKRGTLQHAVWQVTRAVAAGFGDTLDLRVRCKEQAGGLNGERVDFAVVLSLWVAPELAVDVYTQVEQQVAARVAITP